MSSISAGTTSTTTLVHSGDTTGSLVFKTNDTGSGGTTAVTLDTSQNATFAGKVTSAGALTLASNGTTTAVTIDTSQNVGIGTISPNSLLTVQNGNILLRSSVTTGALSSYNLGFSATATGGAAAYITSYRENANEASALVFGTWNGSASGERMRIDSSGNLLVGKTSSDLSTPGFGVDVRSGVLNGVSIIKNDTSWGTALYIRRNATASTGAAIEFSNNGTTVGTVTINASTTSYNTSSDYRLKENIAPMTGALSIVQALKPVTYTWKSDGSEGQGFIAHELQEVVPDCVTGEKDAVNAEGNPVYQGIDTSFLVATLTAAIQELKAINDQQAETINALTARVVALESK